MSSELPSQKVKEPETEITLSQPKKLPVPIVIEGRSEEEPQESHEVVIIEGLYLLHEEEKLGWKGIKVYLVLWSVFYKE